MEIKIGDRFVPLSDSPEYGPKRWTLSVAPDGKRTWTEIEMTEAEKDFDRMERTMFHTGGYQRNARGIPAWGLTLRPIRSIATLEKTAGLSRNSWK